MCVCLTDCLSVYLCSDTKLQDTNKLDDIEQSRLDVSMEDDGGPTGSTPRRVSTMTLGGLGGPEGAVGDPDADLLDGQFEARAADWKSEFGPENNLELASFSSTKGGKGPAVPAAAAAAGVPRLQPLPPAPRGPASSMQASTSLRLPPILLSKDVASARKYNHQPLPARKDGTDWADVSLTSPLNANRK